jgi:hypothetical protein
MSETPSSQEERVRAFWARFAEKVRESGAKPPFDRWLVIRAEEYVAAHPGRRLAEQCPADVDAYLAELGRKPEMKGFDLVTKLQLRDPGLGSSASRGPRSRRIPSRRPQ